MNKIIAENAAYDFACERCAEADCPVKREEAAPETCCIFLENEAPLRLRDFIRKYCGAFGPESVIIPAAYHILAANYSGEPDAVRVSPTSSAEPCELEVKVYKLAKESLAEGVAPAAASGAAASFSPALPLAKLPFDVPVSFDENNELSFKINDIPFVFSAYTPFSELLRTVNEDAGAMVTMELDLSSGGRFSVKSDAAGSDSSLSLCNIRGNFFGENGCTKLPEGVFKTGCDALAEINGDRFCIPENEISYNGITVFINKPTPGGCARVTLSRDHEATAKLLTRFIDELGEITGGLSKSGSFRQRELAAKLVETVSFQTGGTGSSAENRRLLSVEGERIVSHPEQILSALEEDSGAIEKLFTNRSRGFGMGVAYKVKEHMERYLSYWRAGRKPDSEEKSVAEEIKNLVDKYKKRSSEKDG